MAAARNSFPDCHRTPDRVANATNLPSLTHPDGNPARRSHFPHSDSSRNRAYRGYRDGHRRRTGSADGAAMVSGDIRDRFRLDPTDNGCWGHNTRNSTVGQDQHRAGPVRCSVHSMIHCCRSTSRTGQTRMTIDDVGSGAGRMKGMTVPRGIDAAGDQMLRPMAMPMVGMDDLQNNNHVQNYQNRKFRFSKDGFGFIFIFGLG